MLKSSSYYVYLGLLSALSCSRLIYAQSNFSLGTSESFNCSNNLICLGDANRYGGDRSDGAFAGSLSLIKEENNSTASAGIAYYSKSIRMLDPPSHRSASFNISFSFNEIQYVDQAASNSTLTVVAPGDGPAVLISADNSTVENSTETYTDSFGVFDNSGATSFKSIVVEFSTWGNVSVHFMNTTAVATESWGEYANNIGSSPDPDSPVYAWVEYSAKTQQLEVRVSNQSARPTTAVLSYTVDLFDIVEEYMWVGFSGSSAIYDQEYWASYYYIRNWAFKSWGIPAAPTATPSLSPTPTPTLNPSPSPAPRSKVGIIVAISIGVPVLFAILGIFILVKKRDAVTRFRLGNSSRRGDPALQLAGMPEEYRFRYKHLSVATGGFSDAARLGAGGFGNVYRGVLPTSGVPVAVKKINQESKQGEREFTAEVSIISQLRHRNLIQLLGWCNDRGTYLIVYELMPNGSLDKVLFGQEEKHTGLSWEQRFNIISGLAAAVDYLHQGWNQQVIHRDIKSSNIMLDDKWNAKLGDFGLARLVDHQRTAATTLVAGTYGYLAPEAAVSGKFTEKTDVFSFGAVALEVACGRKALAANKPQHEILLVDWVWQRLSEGDLLSVVDSRLSDYDEHWMEVMLQIGLLCSHPDPMARPTMRHVVQVLAGDVPVREIPHSKPVAVFASSRTGSEISSTAEFNTSNSTTNSVSHTSSTPESQKGWGKHSLTMSSTSLNSVASTLSGRSLNSMGNTSRYLNSRVNTSVAETI